MIGCRVAVPCSYWSVIPTPLFIYISQLLRDSFSVSQQPPIWEPPSHYSMAAAHTAQLLQLSQEIFVFTLGTAAAGLLLLANIV